MPDFTDSELAVLFSQPPAVAVHLLRKFYWYPRLEGRHFIQVRSMVLELLEEDQATYEEHETEFTHYDWSSYVGPLWDRFETPDGYQITSADMTWKTINPELISQRFLNHAASSDVERRMIPPHEFIREIADIKSRTKVGRMFRASRKNTGAGWENSGDHLQRRDLRNLEAKEMAQSLGLIR